MSSKRPRVPGVRAVSSLAGIIAVLASFAALSGHTWGNYHWPINGLPVSLHLGDNLTGSWKPYLAQAEVDWDASEVLALDIVPGAPANLRRCAPTSGRIEICNSSYGNNGWLGIASISVSGDHITSGSVRLNDFYFDLPSYNTDAWRQMVTCQEVGHVFGLDHQDENFGNANLGTCMDYTNDPSSNQHPNKHDYDELAAIYSSHDDGTSSGGGSGGGGSGCRGGPKKCAGGASVSDPLAGLDLDTPSQWGRLISPHGPQETYELDLGQGRKIITHVLWVPERARQGHGH